MGERLFTSWDVGGSGLRVEKEENGQQPRARRGVL